jgi:hypothetical protein
MTTGVMLTPFVLKSASFAQVKPPQITASHMLVRAVTRVFHTCGKNCGKSMEIEEDALFRPEFARFSEGAKPGSRVKTPSLTSAHA